MTDNLVERLRDLGIRSADLAADHIEALTARAEAAEAREKEYYEGWNACRFLALETIARAEALEGENARLREAMVSVLDACDQGRMVERGVGGMTIEAQFRRSVYNGIPAWPIEEARAALRREQK